MENVIPYIQEHAVPIVMTIGLGLVACLTTVGQWGLIGAAMYLGMRAIKIPIDAGESWNARRCAKKLMASPSPA